MPKSKRDKKGNRCRPEKTVTVNRIRLQTVNLLMQMSLNLQYSRISYFTAYYSSKQGVEAKEKDFPPVRCI